MSFPGRSLLQAPHTEVLSLRGTTLTCLFDFEAMPLLTAFVGREANRLFWQAYVFHRVNII